MNILVDWLHSMLWRRKFQNELRRVEKIPAMTASDDELWARIAADIEHIEPVRPKRSRRPYALAAAAVIALCFVTARTFAPSSVMSGIKSAPPAAAVLPSSTLAFAILKANGDIVPGSEAARLLPEDGVIFYVETPGLFQGESFTLDILVQTPTGQWEKIVDHYRIGSSIATIKGQLGFIVYKPDGPGIYHFHGIRYLEKTSEKFAGFSVERIP
ncbi:hypothetical protein [Oligoflexus tunisiensis]|uniref:hypothetical protein n=1 Tax=Oligoflexus tunisiensis TaxID=708132 RepID=UPI00114D35A1|nr:hypothetical protein [Oligoflexus tunisiensis]